MNGSNQYFLAIPKLTKESMGNYTQDIKSLVTFKENLDKMTLEKLSQ